MSPWDLLVVSHFAPSRGSFQKDILKGAAEVLAWRKHSERIGCYPSGHSVFISIQRPVYGALFPIERVDGSGNQGL